MVRGTGIRADNVRSRLQSPFQAALRIAVALDAIQGEYFHAVRLLLSRYPPYERADFLFRKGAAVLEFLFHEAGYFLELRFGQMNAHRLSLGADALPNQ